MVISRKFKYLFIEIPQTGCTAVSDELRRNYDGEDILYKHATYNEFLKIASKEEKNYFVFAGVRNPLEMHVSQFFKYKTNHHGYFTNPDKLAANGGFITTADLEKFKIIHDQGIDFPAYFQRYFTSIYNNYYMLLYNKFEFILRFENLTEDFAKALQKIGIDPIRSLPLENKTNKEGMEKPDIWSFYTPEMRDQVIKTHGPFMKKWGYTFPEGWGPVSIPRGSNLRFYSMDLGVNVLANYFNISPHSNNAFLHKLRNMLRRIWG